MMSNIPKGCTPSSYKKCISIKISLIELVLECWIAREVIAAMAPSTWTLRLALSSPPPQPNAHRAGRRRGPIGRRTAKSGANHAHRTSHRAQIPSAAVGRAPDCVPRGRWPRAHVHARRRSLAQGTRYVPRQCRHGARRRRRAAVLAAAPGTAPTPASPGGQRTRP